MLAYGTPVDFVDEYIRIGETSVVECLQRFMKGICEKFRGEYLRRPNNEDIQLLLWVGEARRFPGMLGSIDCSNNDITVLNASNVFNEVLLGTALTVQYTVNRTQYNMGYYLADGIYPDFATFVKTISMPQGKKRKLFAERQESTRKDVERAFGVLQSRFAIIRAGQAEQLMRDGVECFMLFATVSIETERAITGIEIVSEFLEVFPDDVSGLPPIVILSLALICYPTQDRY
ncbi:uncharacterized protein LOC109817687 [Cajanus cajan]|uniref:uncharacterized protein LOC109817687 n=1 Tax=Cajanus cajan TaxID=3821 RepID=UPI00098D8B9D|nr:uncharacterized protein LOC109817687 [Cajanus cajan]